MKLKFLIVLIHLFIIQHVTFSQCTQVINITLTSVNYAAGCDMGDSGGIDPTIDIFYQGSSAFLASFDNLPHSMLGPNQTFPDLPICSYSPSFVLDEFPLSQTSQTVTIEIYEKDSNFFNDDCGGYNNLFDDAYATAEHTFEFNEPTGTIDVGSCISFNYSLDIILMGNESETITGPICPEESIIINNTVYDFSNQTGQETLSGTDGECDTIVDISLNFYTPDPIAFSGPNTFCPATTFTLSANDGYRNYSWSTGETTKDITNNQPGTYSLSVTTVEGCMLVDAITIDTFTRPEIIISGTPFMCHDSETTLRVQGNQVAWNTGSTDNNIIITEPDTYTVTVTDSNGCQSSKSITVTQEDPLPITITSPERFCNGEIVEATVEETYTSYLWSNSETTPGISITSGGTYSVTITDDLGCSNAASFDITEAPLPIPDIQGALTFCLGSSTELTADNTYAMYAWSTSESTDNIIVDAAGDYSLTVTDNNSCTASTSVIVTETTPAEVIIIGNQNYCVGETTSLSADTDYPSYQWNTGSSEKTITVSDQDNYSLTVTDQNGCTSMSSVFVIELPEVQPVISSDLSFCIGSSTTLALDAVYASYNWSTSQSSAVATVNAPGIYTVTVTDSQGCMGSTSVEVVERSELSPEIVGLDVFCEGEENVLGLTSFYSLVEWSTNDGGDNTIVTETGVYSVTVTDNTGCTGTDTFSTETIGRVEIFVDSLTCNPNIVGEYQTTQTNLLGCEDVIITTIEMAPDWPDCHLSTGYRSLDVDCPELQNGKFQLVSAQGAYPIEWRLEDSDQNILGIGTITELNEIIDVDLPIGSYTIKLSSADFLFNNLEFEIGVKTIDYNLSMATTINAGDTTLLTALVDSISLTSYGWFTESESICIDDCFEVLVAPETTTTYRFEFLTEIGCLVTEEVTVTIRQEENLYIPNTFSPSSPAPNDRFTVLGPGRALLKSFNIYDRWGNLVYNLESGNPEGWDGKINNTTALPGLYIYRIVYGQLGVETALTGQVTLLP